MGKHARDDIDQGSNSSPKQAAKSTSACEYCNKEFTTRAIRPREEMHQKQAHDRAAAKKTRSYNFCNFNEAIHEEIISFLHFRRDMITGDRDY
ncbi:hypothetical protein PI125_g7865 [Phytophthora idaei]|nr:hypothetical protein PI125_g7865 [Phytophthora idaei]KAG3146027.1 hypothetical protein PI126_g13491 [Phytophthora idaei]